MSLQPTNLKKKNVIFCFLLWKHHFFAVLKGDRIREGSFSPQNERIIVQNHSEQGIYLIPVPSQKLPEQRVQNLQTASEGKGGAHGWQSFRMELTANF